MSAGVRTWRTWANERVARKPMKIPEEIKFDEKGLVAAVVQEAATGEILMVGYMNREALEQTLETGTTHFWSRSRAKQWQKGESSGHVQLVKEVRFDCDGDALVVKAEQKVAACHTGYRSCFFRKIENDGAWTVVGQKVFEPEDVYGQ